MTRALVVALLGLVLGTAPCAAAAQSSDLELKIKAAFLYNFAKFVDWGPKLVDPDEPIQICVMEPDPFGTILDETVRDKRIATHPLLVRRIASGDLRSCHILYAGTRDAQALGALFAVTSGAGVMTIHEAGSALPAGVARLYLDQNRVRFEINTAAAERENLQISSKLLSVASVVHR